MGTSQNKQKNKVHNLQKMQTGKSCEQYGKYIKKTLNWIKKTVQTWITENANINQALKSELMHTTPPSL